MRGTSIIIKLLILNFRHFTSNMLQNDIFLQKAILIHIESSGIKPSLEPYLQPTHHWKCSDETKNRHFTRKLIQFVQCYFTFLIIEQEYTNITFSLAIFWERYTHHSVSIDTNEYCVKQLKLYHLKRPQYTIYGFGHASCF